MKKARLPSWARQATTPQHNSYFKDAPLPLLFSSFQLADGGASPPFHPFREFPGRSGISVSPPELFSHSPPRSPQRVPQELLDKLNKQFAEGTFSLDMDASPSTPHDHSSPQPFATANPWARPDDYDPELESWFDDTEGAPSKPDKGKKIVTDNSPRSPHELLHDVGRGESSQSEGAPGEGSDDFNITSPESSPERYEHPNIESWEEDLEWDTIPNADTLSPKTVESMKKKADKMSCVNQDSYISWDELEWIQDYYHMEGKSVVPKEGMRPHRFDRENIRIPRMVTTLRHVPLGVTAPLPKYYVDLCEWFQVAPIQLSPNSYMLAAGLYILFDKVRLGAPSMREVSYFFRLAQSQPGYFYLVVQREHNKKGFSDGRNTRIRKWKDTFFYVYNTTRVVTRFNRSPGTSSPCSTIVSAPLFFLEGRALLTPFVP